MGAASAYNYGGSLNTDTFQQHNQHFNNNNSPIEEDPPYETLPNIELQVDELKRRINVGMPTYPRRLPPPPPPLETHPELQKEVSG